MKAVLNPTLDAVRWRSVLDRLDATADQAIVGWHVDNRPLPHLTAAAAMRLAICAMLAGEDSTVAAVESEGGSREVGLWLHRTAPVLARQTGLATRDEVHVPAFVGPLWIDPDLRVPEHLAHLCGEWAAKFGTLVIVRARLRRYSRGRSWREAEVTIGGVKRTVALVEVDHDDAGTVAHEVGHLLAPERLRQDEPFAESLGQEILRVGPWTLGDVEPLVDEAVRQADAVRPPSPLVAPEPPAGYDGYTPVPWHDADGIPDVVHSAMVLAAIGRQIEATP